jgi:hypothetical protein
MINKEEMLTLVRSVAVAQDVEDGMGHAFDLGVDFERARVLKIIGSADDMQEILDHVLSGVEYK